MKGIDRQLSFIIPILTLWSLSLLILNSVSPQSARTQFLVILICALIVYILGRLDYQLYLFSPWPWYVLANALLFSTFVLGEVTRGSIRWVTVFGVSLQTSELAKPLLILFIASYLARYLPQSLKSLAVFCGLMLVPILLIYIQPDLGSALLIMVITATSLIASGVTFKRLAVIVLITIILFPLAYLNLKEYQRHRLLSFANPSLDPLGTGYNALQATIAVGSGKFIGRGLGQGTQSHLRFLPERQTDFIFASLVEELGWLGGIFVIGSYIWLSFGLIQTARSANSDTGSIICLTTLSLLNIQACINMGMNMGIMPITGITLPLVSAGGSSLLSFAAMLGMSFSVARHPSTSVPMLEIR